MINEGQDPMVVCALGDWVCFDTFMKYYYPIRATQSIAQNLLPPRCRVEASWGASAHSIMGEGPLTVARATSSYEEGRGGGEAGEGTKP